MASGKGFSGFSTGISQSKLKAFSIGRMNLSKPSLTKKQREELKKKEEEKKTAEVFNEFVATFEGEQSVGKTFIRGDVINPEKLDESQRNASKLYKPTSKLQELAKSFAKKPASPIAVKQENQKPSYKKKEIKKKSNLELFKEELKVLQAEREIRHTVKKETRRSAGFTPDSKTEKPKIRQSRFQPVQKESELDLYQESMLLDSMDGSMDNGDPMTTNLFLGNVAPVMDEQALCECFGKYGPLASVKIMWPRTDEEKSRDRNCAFVAFMNRKDAERAKRNLQGKDINGYEMKLGWGKTVPIPPRPVYIPPRLLERTLPPPPSGLPFNAQPKDPNKKPKEPGIPPDFRDQQDFEDTLANSVVRVVVPTERNLLVIIHRMIEFVVREGPMFEAMIMNKEINNPMFRFLFENQSPAHIYYRWKTYSILHGENQTKWKTDDFRMFKGGSLWRPPPLHPYNYSMETASSDDEKENTSSRPRSPNRRIKEEKKEQIKKELKDEDRDTLEDILRNLEPRRSTVADAMVFCLEHAEASEEIVDCIAESLSIQATPLPKKIARLYLISDILHNCSAKVANSSFFRKYFEVKLEQVMVDMHKCHKAIQGRLKAEQFKHRVMNCFRAWEDWAIYPDQLLIQLQNAFLGLISGVPEMEIPPAEDVPDKDIADIDGIPLDNENEVDGIPMDDKEADVDGIPVDDPEEVDGVPMDVPAPAATSAPRFVTSKWETVDPTEVEAQAMTTSKWDLLEQDDNNENSDGDNDDRNKQNNNQADDDFKYEISREKLRDIEVKVMKFQDDLESGRREKSHGSISEQVQRYRQKLLAKERDSERSRRSKEGKKKKDKKSKMSSGESDGEISPRHKRKKKKAKDSPGRGISGLVSYDSDDSNDSSGYYRSSSGRKRNTSSRRRSRSRSRSRDRHRRASKRSRSRTPPRRSKRSRSRSRDRRKKKKNY